MSRFIYTSFFSLFVALLIFFGGAFVMFAHNGGFESATGGSADEGGFSGFDDPGFGGWDSLDEEGGASITAGYDPGSLSTGVSNDSFMGLIDQTLENLGAGIAPETGFGSFDKPDRVDPSDWSRDPNQTFTNSHGQQVQFNQRTESFVTPDYSDGDDEIAGADFIFSDVEVTGTRARGYAVVKECVPGSTEARAEIRYWGPRGSSVYMEGQPRCRANPCIYTGLSSETSYICVITFMGEDREGDTEETYVRCDFTTPECTTDSPEVTVPPGTEPPGTEPPGTEPPGTEPPGTEPPGTEPPGTEPPVCVTNYNNICSSIPNSCGMTNPGRIQCNGTCNALPPPDALCPAPVMTLTSEPDFVNEGEQCRLTWSSTDATNCSLTGSGISESGTNGTTLSPPLYEQSTYTLTCENGPVVFGSVSTTCRLNPFFEEF